MTSASSFARPRAPWPPARRRSSTAATRCSAAAPFRLSADNPAGSLAPVEVPVQLLRPRRFGAGLGVEVHDGDDSRVGRLFQGAGVMRVLPGVEEYQVARIRADEGTVPLYRGHIVRVRVVRDGQFAADRVICAEEQAGQWVR